MVSVSWRRPLPHSLSVDGEGSSKLTSDVADLQRQGSATLPTKSADERVGSSAPLRRRRGARGSEEWIGTRILEAIANNVSPQRTRP